MDAPDYPLVWSLGGLCLLLAVLGAIATRVCLARRAKRRQVSVTPEKCVEGMDASGMERGYRVTTVLNWPEPPPYAPLPRSDSDSSEPRS